MQFLATLLVATLICAALLTFGGLVAAVTPDSHRREGLRTETILNKAAPVTVTSDKGQQFGRTATRQLTAEREADQ